MKTKNTYEEYEQLTIDFGDEIPTTEIQEAITLQKKYCKEHKFPLFMPPNSICYGCGRSIFSSNGYTAQQAELTHITGCPFCHETFCD